jgi:hypothetical protein
MSKQTEEEKVIEDVYKLGDDLGKRILSDMGKEYEQEKMFNEYLNYMKTKEVVEKKEENIINWGAVLNKMPVEEWPIEHVLSQELFDDDDIRNLKKIMVNVLSRMALKEQQELFRKVKNL